MITRFAPSPTGFLHLGHVVNAIHVWDAARAHGGGRVLIRIENHDRQRCRPEYEGALLEDLAWLGFEGSGAPIRQSEREPEYRTALQPLIERGLLYGCSCSRAEILAASGQRDAGDDLRYPGSCRDKDLPLGDEVGWRLRLSPGTERFVDRLLGEQLQDPSAQCGDLLLRDRHANWTYQLAATVDDHLQGITEVIRGVDLLPSTARQIRLGRLLGRVEAPRFSHHALVMKSPTEKLSKSDGDSGVRELRAAGWSAADVVAHARSLIAAIEAGRPQSIV